MLEQLFVQDRTLKDGQRSYDFGAPIADGDHGRRKSTRVIVCME